MAERNRFIVLIDFENLVKNILIGLPGQGYSITQYLAKIVEDISQQGEIIGAFAFAPGHLAMEWGETFHGLGFYIISCPKIRGEEELQDQDTTDSTLIKFGHMMIEKINDLTHICLGSGDKHFAPFLKQTKDKGLKITIVAGSYGSLANELIKLADNVVILQ